MSRPRTGRSRWTARRFGTTVEINGQPSTPVRQASDGVTVAAGSHLPKHAETPGFYATEETKPSILERTTLATAVAAMVHGSTSSFKSSDGSEVIPFQGATESIQESVGIKAVGGYPKFNVVGLWSCATLGDDVVSAPSYGIAGLNRAYLGFHVNVSAACWTKAEWDAKPPGDLVPPVTPSNDLGDHAQVLFSSSATVKTFNIALEDANREFPPVTVITSPSGEVIDAYRVGMQLFGDTETRIRYVYLTQVERAARRAANLSVNVWWIKL